MKKQIIIFLITIIVLATFLPDIEEHISRAIVNHKEAGNFINTEDLNLEKLTMLHWFSKDVQVYSENNKELYFVCIDPYKGFTLYKNKKLIMQNESSKYPKYQGGNYMTFSIDTKDYLENRVDFYSEVTLDNEKNYKYDVNFFVGSYNKINDLIVSKRTIDIITIIILSLSIIYLIIINRKNMNNLLFVLSAITMIYDFRITVICFIMSIYLYENKRIKKQFKPFLLIFSLIVPFDFISVFSLLVLVVFIWNYYKKNIAKDLATMIYLTIIYLILRLDLEFSFFRIIYKDIFIIISSSYIIIKGIIKSKCYYPNQNMLKIDLLRGISHDFRVPLSTIKLNVELLEKDDFTTELNKGKILYTVKGALNDLIYMTSTLTSYISSDSYINKNIKTSVQDCIEDTVNYFSHNKKEIIIETKICKEDVYLHIEKVWLNRLIYNLVDNAYKYTDNYGKITIELKKEKHNIFILIEDNGIGISEKELPKILEPFYKIDSSRGNSGLGLGLSIVKSIVDNLGATIEISSKLNKGTKIEIKI